jgi:hypothetical protein
MGEDGFPNSKFELMEKVRNKHGVKVEPKFWQPHGECILIESYRETRFSGWVQWLTRVGTNEVGLRTASTVALHMPRPFSNIQVRVNSTSRRLLSLSMRTCCRRCSSTFVPSAPISAFLIKHRGHGQPARYLIVARRTLFDWFRCWIEWKKSRTSQGSLLNRWKIVERGVEGCHQHTGLQSHVHMHA